MMKSPFFVLDGKRKIQNEKNRWKDERSNKQKIYVINFKDKISKLFTKKHTQENNGDDKRKRWNFVFARSPYSSPSVRHMRARFDNETFYATFEVWLIWITQQ